MAEKSERSKKEEKILQFWKENKIFEKSLEKDSPKGEFVFYDGPPFATGLPHYGHILPGTIKDVIPRYKTMRGYHVSRRWGWDCHGLPIENLIEKELGLETKKDIEKFGIAEFNKRARESVLRFEKDWKEIIPRTGRWVDMENAYKTMDSSYTESVWWSFKELYDKGLVYQGFKSMHLCPRCETTLSNFEVNLNYKDITDISVYVKFELVGEAKTYFLAWTTTPWTLPGNVALAVKSDAHYVRAKKGEESFILLKDLAEKVLKDGYKITGEISGSELVGRKYKTLFDYYNKEGQVYGADFVKAEEGTGVVHIAPGFGEDDYQLSLKEKLPLIQHVGTDGRFKPEVTDFAGEMVKPKDDPSNPSGQAHQAIDIKIIKYLAGKNLLFAKEKIIHSYPHCWRCDTPLLNYASSSWFVKVTEIKDKLIKNNQKVQWVPEDIRDGRFGKWLEGVRDWAVSRSRFWGTPLPVWQNADGSRKLVIDSLETLKKYAKKSKNKYFVMRHGEAKSNAENVLDLTGDPENHLTDKGREEVKNAVYGLKNKNIDIIITSPFLRTKETAEILREELGLPKSSLWVDEHIHETGLDEERSQFKTQIRRRMGQFIFNMDKNHDGKNVLVISHGFPLWVLSKISECVSSEHDEEAILLKTGEVSGITFVPYPHNDDFELDLHRPYIDEVLLEKDGEEYKRVPEVFDTWYDSGSVPFASRGTNDFKPADFIAEGLDQTRGWFYTMAVLGTALFGKSPYKQVVVNGLILAEDGKKMSKRLKNYPELTEVLNKYGADALRYYLMSSPAVRAEDLAFSEKGLDEVVKKNISRLENVVSFYELYKDQPTTDNRQPTTNHILDHWINARLAKLIKEVTEGLENYELDRASRPIADFIDDLSTWYLRRSRTRSEVLPKLRETLLTMSKIIAPFMPFMAEDIYKRLKGGKESVHLEDWPGVSDFDIDISNQMQYVRDLATTGHMLRQKANIPVRQPLSELFVPVVPLDEFKELLQEELNVKEIKKGDDTVSFNTNLTPELLEEGKVRDIIRSIQEWRKEENLKPGEKTVYKIPEESKEFFAKYKEEIKKATNIEF